MAVVTPAGVQAEGNVGVTWVAAIANQAAPALATEINAAGSVDLSGYIKGGTFNPSTEQATGDERRLASTETYQVLGRIKRGLDDLSYVYDPQNLSPTTNKAFTTLLAGTDGFLVVRWGIAATTAYAVGQKVDVIPVECGAQRKVGPAENDEFARLVIQQKLGVTGPANEGVSIAT